jgi:hypothetical protein
MLKQSNDGKQIEIVWQRLGESKQTIRDRDRERVELRVRRCHGTRLLIVMLDMQRGKTTKDLIDEAQMNVRERCVCVPDRIARRYRLTMLRWFCDNDPGRLLN